jgi:phospholipid-binding lipoprotein MlaA
LTLPLLLPVVVLAATPMQDRPVSPATATAAPAGGDAAADSQAAELRDPLADPAQVQADAAVPATPPAPGATRHYPGDPLEGFNRTMFGVHQKLDKAIYRPAAMGYKHAIPKPVRSGIRNFFVNLTEPIVFLNYLLQLKPGKAAETLGRFAINSTIGFGGVLDVAKRAPVSLPHRQNSFGNTLARYGVGPGPYVFLPFVGPMTLRDLLGGPIDGAVLPVAIGKPFNRLEYQVPTAILQGLDLRAEADPELRALFDGAVDPYATLRSAYLQNRAAEIEELRHPAHSAAPTASPELGDPLADPAASTPAPSDAHELADPLTDPAAPQPATP